jgi:hypothetical protein
MKSIKLVDYRMNKSAGPIEIKEITRQWNIDDLHFYVDLSVSIFSLYRISIRTFCLLLELVFGSTYS